jgi:hypothetical protein
MVRRTWWQLLLLLPFVGLMYAPLYATHNIYAFEAGLVLLSAAISWFVYRPASPPARPKLEALSPRRPRDEEPRFTRDGARAPRRTPADVRT